MYSQTLQLSTTHIRKSHPTRVIQSLSLILEMGPPARRKPFAYRLRIYNLSFRISKPAFVCNLLCVCMYKRMCISIYKYLFHYFFLFTVDARRALNAEATWTGRGCLVLASPEDLLPIQAAPYRNLKKYAAYLQRKAWTW